MKSFTKNDSGFECKNCGKTVEPLKYSSRDHCPFCLCSLHVDIMPGDRANDCHGVLVPIDLEFNQNKGYVVVYKCDKCGQKHKNKTADDDSKTVIQKIANKTYNVNNFKN